MLPRLGTKRQLFGPSGARPPVAPLFTPPTPHLEPLVGDRDYVTQGQKDRLKTLEERRSELLTAEISLDERGDNIVQLFVNNITNYIMMTGGGGFHFWWAHIRWHGA
ncbi:hypothetical protein Salat_1477100 [Sesamum alatum]|uniref:Uncharacterized protein n=1 Tax=Sesamum alatum TaxID=300844 RepID=A0AAE2CLZ6_9LAMI|nr:hypothetical protein Salat_1477100 [Sesamum alatum]